MCEEGKTLAAVLKERDNWKAAAAAWESIAGRHEREADELRKDLTKLKRCVTDVIEKLS